MAAPIEELSNAVNAARRSQEAAIQAGADVRAQRDLGAAPAVSPPQAVSTPSPAGTAT